MIVGIDGAFVKATRSKNQRKNFEIVLGRIEACGRQEKIFAAVRDLDDLARERVSVASLRRRRTWARHQRHYSL